MTVYVNEYTGVYGPLQGGFIRQSPIASYGLTSLSTAPFPSAGVRYIRVSADAGSLLCVISTSTATTLTSTNSVRLPANGPPELFAVSTTARIAVASS